ncbi:MAG: pyruvate kinase [Candidatus Heimdallarchaeota archaeon]|nr:pyruvate kinase [Candidatus Heimdallarchaeota archaeon]
MNNSKVSSPGKPSEKRTKSKGVIVGTIGPSSSDPEILARMIEAGLDMVRLNLSHGSHEDHKKRFDLVRSVDDTVPILFDLSGPKIRIGNLKESIVLKSGDTYTLTRKKIIGDKEKASLLYEELIDVTEVGNTLYLNDGLLEFKVTEKTDDELICRVITGGTLSSRKGVNAPNIPINLFCPTDKDIADIDYTVQLEPDFYSVSFVRRVEDLIRVREQIALHTNDKIPLVSKIEHRDALSNIDEIIKHSDGIMVARGDLGIELPLEDIPKIQRDLIDKCLYYSRSCIVATQMLESMVTSPRPTRAEVSDVSAAIMQGSDAVMLSAETATGAYPVETIKVMDRIITTAQKYVNPISDLSSIKQSTTAEAVASAATTIAQASEADKIFAFTRSGITSGILSRFKPTQQIIAITPNVKTARRVKLQWGVSSLLLERDFLSTDEMIYEGVTLAHERGIINEQSQLVIVAGSVIGLPSKTNLIQLVDANDIISSKKAKERFIKAYSLDK